MKKQCSLFLITHVLFGPILSKVIYRYYKSLKIMQRESGREILIMGILGVWISYMALNALPFKRGMIISLHCSSRCLCDPQSSGTIGTLLAPTDSTGTIKRVCWHKPPKWRPLKTCRALNSQNRNVSVSTGSSWRSPSGADYCLV